MMKTFSTARTYFSALFLAVLFLGLQGCGGGGGGSNPPVVVPDANPAGYYTGSATVKDTDNVTDLPLIDDIQIMISESRIMIMSDSKALLYDGTLTVSGNDLTSTLSVYSSGDKILGVNGTATFAATITEGTQITGNFVGTQFGNGNFVATYSTLNQTASDLTNLHEPVITVGNSFWRTDTLNLEVGARHEIQIRDTSGAFGASDNFSVSDFTSCAPSITSSGTFSASTFTAIPNTSFYAVSMNFINCSTNGGNANSDVTGTYTGFAQFKPSSPNDLIAFTVSNGTYSIADDMFRQ